MRRRGRRWGRGGAPAGSGGRSPQPRSLRAGPAKPRSVPVIKRDYSLLKRRPATPHPSGELTGRQGAPVPCEPQPLPGSPTSEVWAGARLTQKGFVGATVPRTGLGGETDRAGGREGETEKEGEEREMERQKWGGQVSEPLPIKRPMTRDSPPARPSVSLSLSVPTASLCPGHRVSVLWGDTKKAPYTCPAPLCSSRPPTGHTG